MIFKGHANRSLDDKGRITLPVDIKDTLLEENPEGKAVLTFFDNCIVGFTPKEWTVVESEMQKIRNPSRQVRNFIRVLLSGSETVIPDKQGRIALPIHLRQNAKIQKDIIVAGVGNRFEIWDTQAFHALLELNYDDVAQELAQHDVNLPF